MKTIYILLVAAIVGFIAAWLCYQVFHLEQAMTTVVTIIVTLAAIGVCDKIKPKK